MYFDKRCQFSCCSLAYLSRFAVALQPVLQAVDSERCSWHGRPRQALIIRTKLYYACSV